MKSSLQGLGRPLFLSLCLVLGTFITLGTIVAKPAPAFARATCSCINSYLNNTVGDNGTNCNCIGRRISKIILGSEGGTSRATPLIARQTIQNAQGENVEITPETLRNNGQFSSLTEYYENVWWPRWLTVMQLKAKEEAATTAAQEASQNARTDAAPVVDAVVRSQTATNEIVQESIMIDTALCDYATLNGSNMALAAQAKAEHGTLAQEAARQLGGAANVEGVPSNRGSLEFSYQAAMKNCDPEFNNGANAAFCTNSNIPARSINAKQIYDITALSDAESVSQAKAFIEETLFGNRVNVISPALLTANPTRQAMAAVHKQNVYNAASSIAMQPLLKQVADSTPMSGVNSEARLREILTSNGVPATLAPIIMGPSGSISLNGLEKILYDIRMQDITHLISKGTLPPAALDSAKLANDFYKIKLLYDIKRELVSVSMLLGGLAPGINKPLYDDAQASIRAVSAP